jgi:hypothetical protein
MPEFTHSNSVSKFGERPPRTCLGSSPDHQAAGVSNLEPVPAPTQRQEAVRALNQLQAALATHGITFPSLDLDIVCLSGAHMRPLIELGRINLETARLLAQALSGMGPQ